MAGLLANNGKPLGKLRGTFFTNGKNRNDYPCDDDSARNAEKEDLMQEKIITGGVIGRLDHTNLNPDTNPNDETLVKEAAVNMQKFPIRNGTGQYVGECLILDTPEGQKLYAYCKSGKKPGISYRGGIDQDAYERGDVEGAWKEFTVEGFDIVYIPAYPECYLELVEDYLDPDASKEPISNGRRDASIDARGAARAMLKVAASKQGAKEMTKIMAQEKHFTESEAIAINKAIDDANIDGDRRTKEQAKELGTPYDASPKHTWARQKGNGTINMFDETGIYGEKDIDPITGKKIETLNTGNKDENDIPVLGLQTAEQKKEAEASAKRVSHELSSDEKNSRIEKISILKNQLTDGIIDDTTYWKKYREIDKEYSIENDPASYRSPFKVAKASMNDAEKKIEELAEDVAVDLVEEEMIKRKSASLSINENGDTMLPPLKSSVLTRMGINGESREVILREKTLTEHQQKSHPDISNKQLVEIIEKTIENPDIVTAAKGKNYWHLIKENIRLSPNNPNESNHGLLRLDITLELVEMVSGYYIRDKELQKEKAMMGELPVSPSHAQAQAAGGADFLQFIITSILLYPKDEKSQVVNAGIEKGTVADKEKGVDEQLEGKVGKMGRYYAKEVNGKGYLMDRDSKNPNNPIAVEKTLKIAQQQADKFNIEDEASDVQAGILGVASEEETTEEKKKEGELGADGKVIKTDKSAITRMKASSLGVKADEDEPEVEILTEDGIRELGSEIVEDESEKENKCEDATMETLVDEIAKLTEAIADLEEVVKGKDEEISNRNSELDDLTASYKRLKGTIASAVERAKASETVLAENADLQERNANLANVVAKIKSDHKAVVAELTAEKDDYKKVIAGYEKETSVRNRALAVQASTLRQQGTDNKVLAGKNDNLGKLCIGMVADMLGIDEGKLLASRGQVRTNQDLERVIASLQKPKRTIGASYYPITEGMRNALPDDLQKVCANTDWNEEDELN